MNVLHSVLSSCRVGENMIRLGGSFAVLVAVSVVGHKGQIVMSVDGCEMARGVVFSLY